MDGALSGEQNLELKLHIETCPACQRELHELHALKGTLQSLHRKPMPEAVAAGLMAAAEPDLQPAWTAWFPNLRILIPAASLTLALLVTGLWLWQKAPGEDAIPVETLLAAHHRYLEEGSLPPADLSADGFSSKLASFQND